MLQEDIALYLQRVGYLAALKREVVGHEREALYLLVVGECLLKGVYALGKHLVDNLVGTQLLTVLEGYAVGTGILLKQGIGGHDEGGDELAVVGHDGYLLHILVDKYLRLYHLRGDVLAVARLVEVLDTLCYVQLAVLHIADIACTEISVGGE